MKFTTKIHSKTGRYRSFQNDYAHIKVKRKVCGFVNGKEVWFHIVTDAGNAPFKNMKLVKDFGCFNEALDFVRNMEKPSWSNQIHFLEG